MKDDKTAMVQLVDPQAGVANKDVECLLRAPVEISYQPIPKDLGLEEPFIAHLGAEEVSEFL